MSDDKLGVIIERLENLKEYVAREFEDIKKNNAREFQNIKDRQDTTNGNVRKNNEWRISSKAVIGFMIVVLLPVAFIVLREWIN